MYTYETLDTPDGPFTLIESAESAENAENAEGAENTENAEETAGTVVASGWSGDVRAVAARAGLASDDAVAGPCRASAAVRAFYAGDAAALASVPIVQRGTTFQTAVWSALREIPLGEVRRYGELAAALGSPGASRAVGAACGRNAVALFVPCHRVVGASGALTGFAWGVDVKRSVLAREGATVPRP